MCRENRFLTVLLYKPVRKYWELTLTQFTVKGHNWVSLTYCDFNSYLVTTRLIHEVMLDVCYHEVTQTMQFAETNFWQGLSFHPRLLFTKNDQTFNCNLWSIKYTWINERNKSTKCWIKLVQDLRGLVKVFSILALIESSVLTLKGYFCSKTIFCYKVVPTAQLMNFLFENALLSRYLDFCVFVKFTGFKICDVIKGIDA